MFDLPTEQHRFEAGFRVYRSVNDFWFTRPSRSGETKDAWRDAANISFVENTLHDLIRGAVSSIASPSKSSRSSLSLINLSEIRLICFNDQ